MPEDRIDRNIRFPHIIFSPVVFLWSFVVNTSNSNPVCWSGINTPDIR
jgi:hypothetical protein